MIIRFTIENWMSFRDPVTFSMIATRERQHGERIPNIPKYKTKLLPIAAVYGGNASGKTNLFKALDFAREFIVRGSQPDALIPVEPFLLEAGDRKRPSRFRFEILVDNEVYDFGFSVTREAVLDERLALITGAREKVLYDRRDGKPHFHKSLLRKGFLNFAFQGTRDNQLFITNSVSQKVETFLPVYNWFKNTLELIAPDSRFGSFEMFLDEENPLYAVMNEMLGQLDTGISRLAGEELPFENLPVLKSWQEELQEEVKDNQTVRLIVEPICERFTVSRKKGELVAKRLVSYHQKKDGTEVKFEIQWESDGSQRLLDLLPAFLALSEPGSNKVFVVDEIDRSLHTLLIRQLLEAYLSACKPESRAQLLLTTHNALLMDQHLLRRDEIWVTERDALGVSKLFSFSEYKDMRYDKDIRKSYLQGRLGGIPRILLGGAMKNPHSAKECEGSD